ncbi:MAG: hypothetical protein RLZ35_1159 [Pseudomonadota bacterium]|jgi:hypothetical protein
MSTEDATIELNELNTVNESQYLNLKNKKINLLKEQVQTGKLPIMNKTNPGFEDSCNRISCQIIKKNNTKI